MKKRSTRGAARVNAIWLIVTLVLFFAVLFAWYTANDEKVRSDDAAAAAQTAQEKAETDLATARAELRVLSEKIGYYDVTDLSATTSPEALQEGLEQFKAAIGSDADAAITTFEAAWPLSISQVAAKANSLTTITQQAEARASEIAATRSSSQGVATSKDAEISGLRTELSDLQTKYTEETNALEGRIARLTQERNTADEESIKARNEREDQAVAFALERSEHEARVRTLLELTRPDREPNGIDGEITGTSASLNIAYINLGTKQRVVRGMVFQVLDADPTKRTLKGEVEIIKVNGSTSEVKILSLTDTYNAIAKGDVIANPMFSTEGKRNAVMVGRFDGKYNAQEVALLLKEIGINVQKELDRSTMYLIMGNPVYKDPETGESLEEPMLVKDLPIFGEAKSMGVQLISIDEMRHFFRL